MCLWEAARSPSVFITTSNKPLTSLAILHIEYKLANPSPLAKKLENVPFSPETPSVPKLSFGVIGFLGFSDRCIASLPGDRHKQTAVKRKSRSYLRFKTCLS